MRITFAEEEDFPNQAALWEANLERSVKGRRGQRSLRELEAALLALPEKRLIADKFEDSEGAVCAFGALAKHKGKHAPVFNNVLTDDDIYELQHEIEQVTIDFAKNELGVPRLVAIAVVAENDEGYFQMTQTPEQRYDRVLRWVQRNLAAETLTP